MEHAYIKPEFQFIDKNDINTVDIVRPSQTYYQDSWRRLKQNRVAMVSMSMIIIITVMALIGPYVTNYDYATNELLNANRWPDRVHWFGTDDLGRDIFVRVMHGTRISLSVGLTAALINLAIGVLYGGVSGYHGGVIDNIMMRIVDAIYAIPMMLYVILFMVVLGKGLANVFLTLGIVYWANMARIVRGQVLSLKEQEFVLAAKAAGAGKMRIILKHLIPNSMDQIIVTLTLSIPGAVFIEAFLSFIGLGVSAPLSSLGVLCSDALGAYKTFPYQLFIPAFTICITMISFNLFGDGLRDALDPKMRK